MRRTEHPQPAGLDLTSCDREPIHIPGSIQPHGLLLVLDPRSLVVRRASRNAPAILGRALDEVLGRGLPEVLGSVTFESVRSALAQLGNDQPLHLLGDVRLSGDSYHVLGHHRGDSVILELEPAVAEGPRPFHDLSRPLQAFLSRLDLVANVEELAELAAAEVRRVTGFDRVLVYRFDDDEHGTVVAENRNDRLPSYSGHRFPASDLPRQARELYRLNRLRLIPDASYTPVPIVPEIEPPVDLSFSTLRSVSPVHLEYMRNMKTAASFSISVMRQGRLWGLISCHHAEPRFVPFSTRAACDLLSQVFSMQMANKEYREEFEQRLRLNAVQLRLVGSLTARENFVEGLTEHADDLLEFATAEGVALLFDGQCTLMGKTPPEADVRRLADWLSTDVGREVFATDSLAARLPWAEAIKDQASGMLAVSISKIHRNFLIWFRPEHLKTVVWAGDPRKPVEPAVEKAPKLSPRASFETWKEQVRFRSAPWRPAEIEAAGELRNAIVGVVLRRAEELAQLNSELRRSNQELEAFSYSVSHDLRAPFRHIVGYSELLRELIVEKAIGESALRYVDTIIESARFAGTLVDNLLAFSRMGRTTIHPVEIDMKQLLSESIAEVKRDAEGRSIVWKVGDLPPVQGDLMMVRLAVINLLANAVKYTRPRGQAVIEVSAEVRPDENVYLVRDNGIGFDMKYADKLFGVFQRLHRMEDFEGTGIGLANVRRIMSRHGGRVWAEGVVDVGATFSISFPRVTSPLQGGLGDDAQTDPAGRG